VNGIWKKRIQMFQLQRKLPRLLASRFYPSNMLSNSMFLFGVWAQALVLFLLLLVVVNCWFEMSARKLRLVETTTLKSLATYGRKTAWHDKLIKHYMSNPQCIMCYEAQLQDTIRRYRKISKIKIRYGRNTLIKEII